MLAGLFSDLMWGMIGLLVAAALSVTLLALALALALPLALALGGSGCSEAGDGGAGDSTLETGDLGCYIWCKQNIYKT